MTWLSLLVAAASLLQLFAFIALQSFRLVFKSVQYLGRVKSLAKAEVEAGKQTKERANKQQAFISPINQGFTATGINILHTSFKCVSV